MSAKNGHRNANMTKVVKVSTGANKTQPTPNPASHKRIEPASHSTEIVEPTNDDYRKAILAALWVAHPRPLSQTVLSEICGSPHKANVIIETLGIKVYEDEIKRGAVTIRAYGLSDKAVDVYRHIQA